LIERTCLTCGKIFYVRPCVVLANGGKYCSHKCYDISVAKVQVECKCLTCGKIYFSTPCAIRYGGGKYCSRKCSSVAQSKRIEHICKECGKIFFAVPNKDGTTKRKYCSVGCASKALLKPRIIIKCKNCGGEFSVLPSVPKSRKKYCSIKCRDEDKISKRTRACKTCGKEFVVRPNALKNNRGKYCSKKCHHDDMVGTNRSNEITIKSTETKLGGFWYGNVKYYGGIQYYYCEKFNNPFKERVRAFWDNTCVECGKKETGTKFCVHHVFYVKEACCMRTDGGVYRSNLNVSEHKENDYIIGNNPNYFVLLCQSCHTKTNHKFENRKKYADKYRKLIDEEHGGKSYYTEEEFRNLSQSPRHL
jgi:hypothetical protein